ncbi:hypothetical protein OHS18_24970 [Amycolatopsis sp. NBC_00355]|uniref:hypothetical protein n=1 Tax=Amycolatopsis sp. NBC_00355 TaxID=2975957 RepID=UPI002E266B7A
MRWLLAELPGPARISTTTGAENAHMIRVNRELGFGPERTMPAVRRDLAQAPGRTSPVS